MGDHFSLFISWEVFSPLKSKMQVLVVLLLSSLVYGAVSPAKREADPAHHGYSSGPRCHDKKDHQCHKIPKHQEHDECEHIVDTTYIEGVSMLHTLIVRRNTLRFTMNLMLLVMTLMWSIMDLMVMEDITSVKLMLKLLMVDTLKDIPMVLSAMTRRTNSATRSPSHRSTRSARRLWTPPTLRSVRRLCTLIVKKNTRKFIIAAM